MAAIAHLVRIRATPEEIYRRVATTSGIAEWFTEASSPDYCEGGTLKLRFSDEPVSFEITELVSCPMYSLHNEMYPSRLLSKGERGWGDRSRR